MMATVRTNPAYAALAYRRTIIHNMIILLKREFVGLDAEPNRKMICEDVLHADSEVPAEEIIQYVEELEQEQHELTLELNKFEFTRKGGDDAKFQQAKARGSNGRNQKGGQGPR
jgi:hypothetical protein